MDKQEKNAWERWKDIAARAATFQARVLLGAFYWTFVTPFAFVVRYGSDPLKIGEEADGGQWVASDVSSAPEEQF